MAKTRKLLICVLMVACMLIAVLPVMTASAAESYEYVKSNATTFVASDTPVMLVGKYNGSYYAITANGTGLKSTIVTVEDGKVTSGVTDDMLWIVGKSGWYRTFRSYSKGTYLNNTAWGASLSSTAMTYYTGLTLQNTNDYYLFITSAAVSGSSSTSTTFEVYVQTPIASGENSVTVTFDKGNDSATGTMNNVSVEAGAEYTLPTCSFKLTNYAFAGWSVNGETKAEGDTITVSADTTVTATWVYNCYDITFKMEGQDDKHYTVEKGKSFYMKSISIFNSSAVPEGKIFSHWIGNDGIEYKSSTNYTFTSDMEFTPVFVDAVTVHFDLNGGTAAISGTKFNDKTVVPGSKQTLYDGSVDSYMPTKDGYILYGWLYNGKIYTNGESYTVADEDMTFVAVWRGLSVTFTVNGEEYHTVNDIPTNLGNYDYVYFYRDYGLTTPTLAGYKFIKWQCTTNSYTSFTPGSAYVTYNKLFDGIVFEAVLEEVKTGTITLHYGEETKELTNVSLNDYMNFNATVFTDNFTPAEGYVYDGWYSDEELTVSATGNRKPIDGEHYYAKVKYMASLEGINAVLGGEIQLQVRIKMQTAIADSANTKVVVTDATGAVYEYAVGQLEQSNGYYIVKCSVAAADMTKTVNIAVTTNGVAGVSGDTSVMEYLNALYNTEGISQEARDLASAILNYGAAAQEFFGRDTDNLANSGKPAPDFESITSIDAPATITNNGSSVTASSAMLTLESKTILTVYLSVADGASISDYTYMLDGNEVGVIEENGKYMIKISDIDALNLDTLYTISVVDGDETVYEFSCSALTYAKVVVASSADAKLVKLAKSLYLYNTAAEAYAASIEQ